MKRLFSTLIIIAAIVAALGFFGGQNIAKHIEKLIYPAPYSETVEREAAEFGLDSSLVYAVMRTESRFDPKAESKAGAKGIMQLTPETFDWISSMYPPENGGDIFSTADNIHCGCAFLRLLLDQYGEVSVALCAYNAGMGNVSQWLSDERYSSDGETLHTIPYPETNRYVEKVLSAKEKYEKIYAGR